MIQCGVTHKWIIHSHWLSPRLRKNDYMSWFSPAFPQSPGQMRTVLSSRPPDSHDNGHCSRVWYSDWVGWSEATLHKQKEQPVPKQTIAWHRGKEGRFCSGPFLTPSCLLSSPPCLVLGVRSGVHLSVAYPLPSEGPWDLGKFLCALPLIFHIPNWGRPCRYMKETDGAYHRVLSRTEAQTCPLFLWCVFPSVDSLLLAL